MNVSLTPRLAQFVEDCVASGLYGSASEVVRTGLRILIQFHERRVVICERTPAEAEEEAASRSVMGLTCIETTDESLDPLPDLHGPQSARDGGPPLGGDAPPNT